MKAFFINAYGSPASLQLKEVETPIPVILKSGEDHGLIREVIDGNRLLFGPGEESPMMNVSPGESVNIRHRSLKIHGKLFPEKQLQSLLQLQQQRLREEQLQQQHLQPKWSPSSSWH